MEVEGKLDERQYGFRSNRDTIGAVQRIVEEMGDNKERGRRTLIVTLDLSIAFSTAWGPSAIESMERKGFGKGIRRMVKSFLKDRVVVSEGNEWSMEKRCPQGSCLGPILWLIIMEEWFKGIRELREMGVTAQAYADNQVVVIAGRSVREVERKWKAAWDRCGRWAEENKLTRNVSKTKTIFVSARGKIREPILKIGEERIICEGSIRYLGIIIDGKRLCLKHVTEARRKVQDLGGRLIALGRRKWGKKEKVLKLLYERVIGMIVLYGAEIWGEGARDSRVVKQLNAIERPYLRAITAAYATAPTAALSVVAGRVPLGVRAKVRYECGRTWGERIKQGKVTLGERPHPAYRGWMPQGNGYGAEGNRVKMWGGREERIRMCGKK